MMENEIVRGAQELFENPFVQALVTLAVILVVQLVVNAVISFIVPKLVRDKKYPNKVDEKKREDTLASVFRTLAGFAIWIIGLLIILGQLGVNIAALATGAGLLGIVIGFGAQKLIQDFLAGIFIVLENQYRVGDWLTLDAGSGVSGEVEDFSIRITRLRDMDGNLHIVSNGAAVTATNYTVKFGNINMDIRVSYEADIDKVEKIINDEGQKMAKEDKWQKAFYDPIAFLRVNSLDESSVTVKAFGTVKAAEQWAISGEFRRRIKKQFEKNGIVIPYQQIVVHEAPYRHGKKK